MDIIKDPAVKCVGCYACLDSCPKHCISMVVNNNNLTATIDPTMCVQCGLCSSVCQMNDLPQLHSPIKCYAAWDDNERNTSSSGGIATSIAKNIIENGGVVIGCALENNEIHHILIDSIDELYRIKTSKYVKSDMTGAYKLIRKNKDRKICCIGTPCFIAGIKKYCETTNINRDNIILIDLICHGTPNQYILKDIVGKDKLLSFRDGNSFRLQIENKKRKKYHISYMLGFLKGLFYNEACYDCYYAQTNRVSDITVGDFWEIEGIPEEDREKGVSLVLINTIKGETLFNNLPIIKQERTIEEARFGNPQLVKPSIKHRNHGKFLSLYPNKKEKCLPGLLRKERLREYIKSIVFSNKVLKSIVKRILR